MTQEWRSPNLWESALVERLLLTGDFQGRAALLEQWAGASVQTIDDEGSFAVRPAAGAPDADVLYRIPTEGEIDDRVGGAHVLRHVIDDRMSEVEVYQSAGEPVARGVDLTAMTVWAAGDLAASHRWSNAWALTGTGTGTGPPGHAAVSARACAGGGLQYVAKPVEPCTAPYATIATTARAASAARVSHWRRPRGVHTRATVSTKLTTTTIVHVTAADLRSAALHGTGAG